MYWSWILSAFGVFGIWLAGRKNKMGWAVGMAAQLLWTAYATLTHQYGFLVSAVLYFWVYAKNFLAWRSETTKEETS